METATLFASSKSRWTDNELMSLPNDGRKYELIVLPRFKCKLREIFLGE